MKKAVTILSLLFVFVCLACSSQVFSQSIEPSGKEAKDLVQFVKEATSLVEKQGETAFVEFKKKNSKWLIGDRYVFVVDTNGNVFVNPHRPELEGKNQINLKDLAGKQFIRSFITEATGYSYKKEGWTHYVWLKPGEENPSWKTSYVKYVKTPSGKDYIIGSGLYSMKMDKAFVVNVVDEAVELISKQGNKAFTILRDPLGEFNYLTTYVFVINSKGKDLVNPAFPGYEGQDVRELKDYEGKPFIKEIMKSLENNDAIWVTYQWPKPRQASPSKKSSYIRKTTLGGETLYVGSGVYLD
ncbi:MAG TPA: cache domain-containing protein [Syntrophorhabdaceae bacterium]|jgi:signal transduction histidine kinase|nr:cache domain-containing protein [Syntrophorhabdaceae bacterium]HNZ58221.1 cache domain-containing protein [Syntrophorhabdaceae bacterium]HOB68527.1 cache domain-containing protein [Syntrophorhabdaceae bacterium]HOF57396.1 cache domain-containing protein [Syntrophorhabdaceae bacterium]HOS05342.1 cache domain-containing protein [Syntrophorhabdaceae bacterium]